MLLVRLLLSLPLSPTSIATQRVSLTDPPSLSFTRCFPQQSGTPAAINQLVVTQLVAPGGRCDIVSAFVPSVPSLLSSTLRRVFSSLNSPSLPFVSNTQGSFSSNTWRCSFRQQVRSTPLVSARRPPLSRTLTSPRLVSSRRRLPFQL